MERIRNNNEKENRRAPDDANPYDQEPARKESNWDEKAHTDAKSLDLNRSQNFNELYEKLDQLGNIEGTKGTFTATQLKDKIDRVRKGLLAPDFITRTHGLRDTVLNLLQNERPNKNENLENTENQIFTQAQSFKELYEMMDRIGTIRGSKQDFSAEELKALINLSRNGGAGMSFIPRTGGLRQRVIELLEIEKKRESL